MGRQECLWGRCEHEVALLNAQGRITSKDKPWELAGQIAVGGKEGGRWMVWGGPNSWWSEELSIERHLYLEREAILDAKLNSHSG